MHPFVSLRCLAAAATFAAVVAHAEVIPLVNSGFEEPVIPDGAFIVTVPSGWQLYDPSGVINQNANSVGLIRPSAGQTFFPTGAPEGNQAALVFLAGVANGPAGLQQVLNVELAATTQYTLTVEIGNIASGTSLAGSSDGGGSFYNLAGFPGYRIELLAGDTVIGADSTSAGEIPEGEWRSANLIVSSDAFPGLIGQPLTVRLVNVDNVGTTSVPNIEVDFDAVQLVATPVPEPAVTALWLAGLALLGGAAATRNLKRGAAPRKRV